ncbi:MAG: HAD family phosphatase [Alistipes sp.]
MTTKINIPGICAPQIEALIFDLGGVVLDVDFARTVDAFRALQIEGVEAVDVMADHKTIFRDLELGLVSPEGFLEALRRTYPVTQQLSDARLWQAWNALLLSFDRQRVELLRGLGKQGKIYLLSNTNLPHRVHFRKQFAAQFGDDFDTLFAACFYSDELHLRKPDSAIYRHVAAQIGVAPEKILFIDDNADNIAQARREGWQSYRLFGGERITDLFDL